MGDAARQVLGTCRYQGENGREALPSCPRIHTPGIRDKASASPAFMQRISSSIRIDTSANGPSSRFPNRRCRVSVQYRKLDQGQGHVSLAPCFHHQSQPLSVVVSRCPVWACVEGDSQRRPLEKQVGQQSLLPGDRKWLVGLEGF